jgi:hypothetical protein
MDARDSRDLDGVIDDVARAMTGTELARDLRPAIAARIASPASWATMPRVWRAAVATAALAAAVLLAVARWPGESGRPARMARSVTPESTVGPVPTRDRIEAPVPVTTVSEAPRSRPRARAIGRQTIVDAPAVGGVDVEPLAIVPLESVPVAAEAPRQVVNIAPIDVGPVRIRELGEQVE